MVRFLCLNHFKSVKISLKKNILTYNKKVGDWLIANRRAVIDPPICLLIRATFTRFFSLAPTVSQRACNLWHSMLSDE